MLGEGIQQLYVFLTFVATGVMLSVPYLFLAGLCKNKVAAVAFDGCYGALSLFAVWKLNVEVNNGDFRWFVFVALVLGVIIVCTTCKTTLDKLSAALYNLLTSLRLGKDDGETVLQKEHSNFGNSGSRGADISAVHVADQPDSTFQPETNVGKTDRNGKSGKNKRGRKARTDKLPQNGQVRDRMGDKNESHSRRRHKLHRK